MDNKSLSHTKWKCQYHIVFIFCFWQMQDILFWHICGIPWVAWDHNIYKNGKWCFPAFLLLHSRVRCPADNRYLQVHMLNQGSSLSSSLWSRRYSFASISISADMRLRKRTSVLASIGLYIDLTSLCLKSVRKLQKERFDFIKILAFIIAENEEKSVKSSVLD